MTSNMRLFFPFFLILAFAMSIAVHAPAADNSGFCTTTANTILKACKNGAQDDHFIALAVCLNISNDADRAKCNADAKDTFAEDIQLCEEQLDTRLHACELLGEDRYDPNFDPSLFDDDFNHLTNPNPYFPLKIGNEWIYHSETEVDTVKIQNRTKLIDGVTCVVARDIVEEDGFVTEATNDWYAQAKDGTTWYCGEETATYETFEGDHPVRPELIDNEGSFKAGRDGDKPGIIFLATPKKGSVYLEEFSLNNAEDVTRILSTTYSFGSDPKLDKNVPRKLVDIFCHGDCVVTKNFSLLEPGLFARKYYARGVGVILEIENTGEVVQLVNCNFDSRCSELPTP